MAKNTYNCVEYLNKLRPRLIRYATNHLHMSLEDVKDAFQTICMRVLAGQEDNRLLQSWRNESDNFEGQAWLYLEASVSNYQKDLWKAPKRAKEVQVAQLPDGLTDSRIEESVLSKEKTQELFRSFNEAGKQVLRYHALGYERWEIATEMKISPKEVHKVLERIKNLAKKP